jgi:hypothetical protein
MVFVLDERHDFMLAFRKECSGINYKRKCQVFTYANGIEVHFGYNKTIGAMKSEITSCDGSGRMVFYNTHTGGLEMANTKDTFQNKQLIFIGRSGPCLDPYPNPREATTSHEVLPAYPMVEEVEIFDAFYNRAGDILTDAYTENGRLVSLEDGRKMGFSFHMLGERVQEAIPGIYARIARERPDFLMLFEEALEDEIQKIQLELQVKGVYTGKQGFVTSTEIRKQLDEMASDVDSQMTLSPRALRNRSKSS